MNGEPRDTKLINELDLSAMIEGILFYKSEPVKKSALASILGVSAEDIETALALLAERLRSGGTRLVLTDTMAELVTAQELSDLIQSLRKDELKSDIGKAGAETLSIVLYRGPLTRAEIDRIRGVNSTFIVRNLLVRGLIERRDHPTDSRSFVYAATPMLLNHLGITRREELPDFSAVMDALDVFERDERTRVEEAAQVNDQ